jgi:hypothetical protein
MRSVAWWILTVKKENRFLAHEIPEEYIPAHLRARRASSSGLREALVGSVIEPISMARVIDSKGKRYYYFPHKSYIEFLVAEFFIESSFSVDIFRSFIAVVNREILSFIAEQSTLERLSLAEPDIRGEGHKSALSKLRDGLTYILGPVDPYLVSLCAQDTSIDKEFEKPNQFLLPSQIYTQYIRLSESNHDPSKFLLRKLGSSRTVESTAAVLNCICAELKKTGSELLARDLFVFCFTAVFIQRTKLVMAGDLAKFYIEDKTSLLAAVIGATFSLQKNSGLYLDLIDLALLIENAAKGSFYSSIGAAQSVKRSIHVKKSLILGALGAGDPQKKGVDQMGPKAVATDGRVREEGEEGWATIYSFIVDNRQTFGNRLPIRLEGRAQEKFLNGLM